MAQIARAISAAADGRQSSGKGFACASSPGCSLPLRECPLSGLASSGGVCPALLFASGGFMRGVRNKWRRVARRTSGKLGSVPSLPGVRGVHPIFFSGRGSRSCFPRHRTSPAFRSCLSRALATPVAISQWRVPVVLPAGVRVPGACPYRFRDSIASSFLATFHLRAHEFCNGIIRHERNPAQFATLTDANEPPVTKLLAAIVEAPPEPEERITASLRKTVGFRALRRTSSCGT